MRVLQTLALPLGHVTIISKKPAQTGSLLFVWSGRRGSNSLPPPWQGGALPDELRPHIGAFTLAPVIADALKTSFKVGEDFRLRDGDPDRARTDDPQRDRLVL